MCRGLMKNSFALMNFRVLQVIGATVASVAIWLSPLALVLCSSGTLQLINGLSYLLIALIFGKLASKQGYNLLIGLFAPIGMAIYLGVLWASMVKTLWHGGISWRGTFYSTRELMRK